jgi:hypothetical protein
VGAEEGTEVGLRVLTTTATEVASTVAFTNAVETSAANASLDKVSAICV